jgi:hypothetical protein
MPVTRVVSGRKIPVFAWVPPVNSPIFKIELEKASTGVKLDVTDLILSGEYTDGITETIGNFSFQIDNSTQSLNNEYQVYDIVNVYMDYTTATTLKFKGRMERISYQNNELRVTGRSLAVRTVGITVTKQYSTEYTHDILQDLLDTYATYITQTNIDTTTSTDTQITVDWYQKPFWECVQELCSKAGYDAYINASSDMNYFVSGTRSNSTDAVVHESNLIDTGDFTPDLSVVKNRVIVYGAQLEGIPIFWTESDAISIANYDVKELIINDSNIFTIAQAQARAEYELSVNKDPPVVGEVTSLGLPTILPGEKVQISDPLNNLDPQYYAIQKFTHKFSNDEPMQTILTIQKEISTIPKILKKRIQFEQESTQKDNPFEMRYAYLDTFDSATGTTGTGDSVTTTSNPQIVGGVLKTDGSSTATWISNTISTEGTITSFELRAEGDVLSGTTYAISFDSGVSYQSISSLNTEITASPPGTTTKLKITLNSAQTQIKSIGLFYKI